MNVRFDREKSSIREFRSTVFGEIAVFSTSDSKCLSVLVAARVVMYFSLG